jgi:hypothetical protein
VNLRTAILSVLALLGSQPAMGSLAPSPITRKSLSGLWEGIEPLSLSVFMVEIGTGRSHQAVLVRENRTIVFHLNEPKVEGEGQVSLNGREAVGAMTLRITGSGDATEGGGYLKARVELRMDPQKYRGPPGFLDEFHDIYFVKPGGDTALRLQRLEAKAKDLLWKP